MITPLLYKPISVTVEPTKWDAFVSLAHAEDLSASAKIRQMVAKELRMAAKNALVEDSKSSKKRS
jgi:hypothetical protein